MCCFTLRALRLVTQFKLALVFPCLLLILILVPVQAQEKKKLVDFKRDVFPILRARCTECHQGPEAKNDFQVLNKEAMMGYIDSSGADSSSLWIDYLTAPTKTDDPESLIMPPKGPLSTLELATLKLWLDEGAVWPDDVVLDDVAVSVAPTVSQEGAAKYLAATGYFHPAIVHFPIALILFAAMAVCVSYVGGGENFSRIAYYTFVVGAIMAVLSAIAGWGFATEKGYVNTALFPTGEMSESAALLYRHRWFGVGAAALSLVIAIIAVASYRGQRTGHIWRLGILVCALLVSLVGHQGGELYMAISCTRLWNASAGARMRSSLKHQTLPDKD